RPSDLPDVLVAQRDLPAGDPASLPPPPADADAVRWIFYTSGTTADPKGATHTDTSVVAAGRAPIGPVRETAADRLALVFPFTHIGGVSGLATAMLAGLALIVVEAFDPATTVDVLAREGVTLASAGTPFWMAYLAVQRARPGAPIFPAVRAFPGGGAPKPVALHDDVKRELG